LQTTNPYVDDLAVSCELHEDSANPKGLERLNRSLSVRRRYHERWSSCLADMLLSAHRPLVFSCLCEKAREAVLAESC
jgi:hypothetical protein